MPVGGAFTPKSFSEDTDASWQKDMTDLQTLKAKGIVDLILTPPKSLVDVKPAACQKLLDYLDANGFQYGISFGSGLEKPLQGLVVRPTVYRYQEKGRDYTASFQVSNTNGGLYLINDPDSAFNVVGVNYINVSADVVTVPVEIQNSGDRLITTFYPHKTLRDENTIPDLWNGYDEYRDRLLSFFSKVKPGKGLRFFSDPLAKRLGFGGDADFLVPDSPGFRLEWEAFLNQQYNNNTDRLRSSWGLATEIYGTVKEYANLVPLYEKNHGSPYYYDPTTQARHLIAETSKSRWWENYTQFRDSSIQYYMNSTADLLKSQVANVPVLYTWTQSHEIFLNREPLGGFDGLCAPAQGASSSLMVRTLGPAYSEVTQANRALWFLATETSVLSAASLPQTKRNAPTATLVKAEAPERNSPGGFASSASLNQTFSMMLQSGAKGIFVGNLASPPAGKEIESSAWLDTPASLEWLRDFGQKLAQNQPASRYSPRLLYYPGKVPGPGVTGFIPGTSTLWLNSFYEGEPIDLWPAISGYKLYQDDKQRTILTSLTGRREVHIHALNAKGVRAYSPDGVEIPIKVTNKVNFSLTLDTVPTIIDSSGLDFTIEEPSKDILEQLDRLYSLAASQKLPELQKIGLVIDSVKRSYLKKDYDSAYSLGSTEVRSLTEILQTYQWIEAENTKLSDFDEKVAHPDASGGVFFNLGNPNDPPPSVRKSGYSVSYNIDVAKDGVYNIWLAGSLPGPSTSDFVWRFDTQTDIKPADASAHGPKYLRDRFGWMLLGTVRITKEKIHRITIAVEERAQNPAIYSFAVDALMLTPAVFHPNGTVRPLPMEQPFAKKK